MKKIIVLSLMICAFAQVNAQNCKYKTNEVDKFTGKYTKITKSEKVIGTFYTQGSFSVKKIDTTYYFMFDYTLSSYSNFDPYAITKGAKLIFLLENGETITLASEDNINGTKKTVAGLPPVYTCELQNVSYQLTKSQIDKFLISKVKSIRFYRNESNGKEDFVDNDISKKNQDDIQNLVKCVL